MFNLRQFKLVKELKNKKPQMSWLKFSNSQNRNDEFLNSVIADNKFVQEKRSNITQILVEQFGVEKFKSNTDCYRLTIKNT